MDISGVMENAASTITGSVAKAKIKIQDNRARKTKKLTLNEMGKQKTGGAGGFGAVSNLTTYTSGLSDALVNAVAKTAGVDLDTKYNRMMEVQFNPASLRLSAMGGDDDVQTTNYTQDGAGISRGAVGLHVEMSVKLIFDQISNYAAFTQDMLTVSTSRAASQAASAIGGAISNALKGTPASVQQIVESFVSTMRNENTRRICFQWGEFYYEGVLSRVNSTYTMFDLAGNPIRAEVMMVLYLVDDDLDKEFNEYWEDAYFAAFIESDPAALAMYNLLKAKKGLPTG